MSKAKIVTLRKELDTHRTCKGHNGARANGKIQLSLVQGSDDLSLYVPTWHCVLGIHYSDHEPLHMSCPLMTGRHMNRPNLHAET